MGGEQVVGILYQLVVNMGSAISIFRALLTPSSTRRAFGGHLLLSVLLDFSYDELEIGKIKIFTELRWILVALESRKR